MENNDSKTHPFDIHPLEQLVQLEHAAVNDFSSRFPDFWEATQTASNASYILQTIATHLPNLSSAETLRLFLWQNVRQYQFLSLKSIVIGDLDVAYTLLRNATELSRDIANIKDDETADRWRQGKFSKKRDNFFRFNDNDPTQAFVHKFYKVASDLGTHGHFMGMLFGKAVDRIGPDGHLAVIQIPDNVIVDSLVFWLSSFAPILTLCALQYAQDHPEDFSEGWGLFVQWNNSAQGFLKDMEEKLTKNQKTHGSGG